MDQNYLTFSCSSRLLNFGSELLRDLFEKNMSKNKEWNALVLGFVAYFAFYYNRKCVTLVFPQLIKEGLTQQNAGNYRFVQDKLIRIKYLGKKQNFLELSSGCEIGSFLITR